MGLSGTELPGMGGSIALSLLSLGIICCAAYVLLRWLGRAGVGRSDDTVRVIGRCSLEPRRSVYLIEVASRCFLVGVGDGPVNLLAEIDRASIQAVVETPAKPGNSFAEILARVLGRRGR